MSANTAAQAAPPAWRVFSFFHSQAVHDRTQPGSPPPAFKNVPEISAIAAGQGQIAVADIHGRVHICNPDLDIIKSWTAHANGHVTHLRYAGTKGILVTLGEETSSVHPVLKIWNTRHGDNATAAPRLLVSGRLQHGARSHPVSTMAIIPDLSIIAVGLADGTVLLLRQLDQYTQSASSNSVGSIAPATLPNAKVIHSSPTSPITGLAFRNLANTASATTNTITGSSHHLQSAAATTSDTKPAGVILFIVTTHQVMTYSMTPTGKGFSGSSTIPTLMDDVGAALHCSAMLGTTAELVLARDEAIFIYGPEGRGQSYYYEGPKSAILTSGSHIIITSPPFLPSSSSQSATVRNFMRDQRAVQTKGPAYDNGTDIAKVTIFDAENRFVAYSGAFPGGVREVFAEWGDLFVLTNDSKLHRLVEQPTQAKIASLLSKNLYTLAISLAKSSGSTQSDVGEIYRTYGDHFYDKSEYDNAMMQYIKTIGVVQPSYVIRRFLDGQRINELTSYLQELHSQKLANADITTLLLNCYAKLKDTERLRSFIDIAAVSATGELPFDIDTAVRVCRQAGYFEEAVYLASKFDQMEHYLQIQIEDRQDWQEALRFIRTLDQQSAEDNLRRYGKALLEHKPQQTTDLLIDLCCGVLEPQEDVHSAAVPTVSPKTPIKTRSYLSYLALTRSTPAVPVTTPDVPPSTSQRPADSSRDMTYPQSPAIAHRRQITTASSVNGFAERPISTATEATLISVPDTISVPLPDMSQFNALFMDNTTSFIRFLETVLKRRWQELQPNDDVYSAELRQAVLKSANNTLLELYLSQARATPDERTASESKALGLLQNKTKAELDVSQALIVCCAADFIPGLLAVYERMEMYDDILRFWIDQDVGRSESESDDICGKVIAALHKYGARGNPQLYPIVLRYLTSSAALLSRHQADLLEVLKQIEKDKIMPPIAVIQALSKSKVATVGVVKEYLTRSIISQQADVDADRALAESYRSDLRIKEKEISELNDPASPRVFQVTRCSACGGALDLPAVHFMCKHSYHQRCLADNEASCPTCAADHGVIMEIKAANDQLIGRHDLFMQEFEESDDKFEGIIDAFSRGIIRNNEG